MPAASHPVFTAPDNPNIKIWRYMDFTKFVSMLENGGLYFCRTDKLGDPFEGFLPKGNLTEVDLNKRQVRQEARRWMFVNCWHMNEHESAAMWKIYCQTNESVAICSTYQKLAAALDTSCWVGKVEYIDHDKDAIPESNLLFPFVHKRKSFAHEQELRAATASLSGAATLGDARNFSQNAAGFLEVSYYESGVWRMIDLSVLIDEIYVAPTAPTWFKELVEKIAKRLSLDKPVRQSRLDDKPLS